MANSIMISILVSIAVVVVSASSLRGGKVIDFTKICEKAQSECLEYDICDACYQGMFLPSSLKSKTCDGLLNWLNEVIYDDVEACAPVLERLVMCELNALAMKNDLVYCKEKMFPTKVNRKAAVDMNFSVKHQHKHKIKVPVNKNLPKMIPNEEIESNLKPQLDAQPSVTSAKQSLSSKSSSVTSSSSTAKSSASATQSGKSSTTSTTTSTSTTSTSTSSSPSTFHNFNQNIFTPSDTMMDSSIYSDNLLEGCDDCHHHDVYHGYNPDIFTPSDSFMDSSYYSDTWSEQDDFASDLDSSSSYYTSGSFHSSQSGISDVYSSSFSPFI